MKRRKSISVLKYSYRLYVNGRRIYESPVKNEVMNKYKYYVKWFDSHNLKRDIFISVVCEEIDIFGRVIRVGFGSTRSEAKKDLTF